MWCFFANREQQRAEFARSRTSTKMVDMIEFDSNAEQRGTLSSWEQVRRRQRSLDADPVVDDFFPSGESASTRLMEETRVKSKYGEGDLLLDELLEMMASEEDVLESSQEEERLQPPPPSPQHFSVVPPPITTTMKEEMVEIATPVTPTWGIPDAAWHQWAARSRSPPINAVSFASTESRSAPSDEETKTPKKIPQNVSRFPGKLADVLSQPSLQHVCRWDSTHRAVVVLNFEVFCTQVLPTHFTLNPKSFHRQLNYYGFEIHKPPTSLGSQCKIWVNRDPTVTELKDVLRLRRYRKPHKSKKVDLWGCAPSPTPSVPNTQPEMFDSAVQVTPPNSPFSTFGFFYDRARQSSSSSTVIPVSSLPHQYLRSTCIPGKKTPTAAMPTPTYLKKVSSASSSAQNDFGFPLVEPDIIQKSRGLVYQESCRATIVAPRIECATY